ncbi:MAG: hypothetical protein H7Z40_19245 [Phycisphaerae bacterium]|nr:hypothetical protein [Gemmatimonadaceae bacterium]
MKLTPADWAALSKISRPEPIREARGLQGYYKRRPDGQMVLASNLALRPAQKNNRPMLTPHTLRQPKRVLEPAATPFNMNTRPNAKALAAEAALLWGLTPEVLVNPARRVVLCGTGFDKIVEVNMSRDEPNGFTHTFSGLKTERNGDDVGCSDGVFINVPVNAPVGRYLVSVRNAGAAWSNPAPLTIRGSFPTKPYLVGVLEHLEFPKDYDDIHLLESGNEQGELRFNLFAGTGSAADTLPPMQRITFGDAISGFEIRNATRYDPPELQVPFFTSRLDKMNDQLLITFLGHEMDGPSSTSVVPSILASIVGAGVGAYLGGPGGASAGYKLGKSVGDDIAEAIKDGGDQPLGSHTQVYTKEDDFGLSFPAFPTAYNFDNNMNTEGANIRVGYRMRAIDAPSVSGVRVTLDSIDTRDLAVPPPSTIAKVWVNARALIGPNGQNYAATRPLEVQNPAALKKGATLAKSDRLILDIDPPRDAPLDFPYLYFEVTLWRTMSFVTPGMFSGTGIPLSNMVARPMTVFFLPNTLLREGEVSATTHHKTVVKLADDRGSQPGKFTVYYTIKVDRDSSPSRAVR